MTDPRELSGRDLDAAVAGVRGDVVVHHYYCPDCEGLPEVLERIMEECAKCRGFLCAPQPLRPYHKDDAMAAELRREMREGGTNKVVVHHAVKGTTEGPGVCVYVNHPSWAAGHSDTEATATARAYLAFKEQQE